MATELEKQLYEALKYMADVNIFPAQSEDECGCQRCDSTRKANAAIAEYDRQQSEERNRIHY